MIQRLIPKYPTFLVLGLVIVASGLLLMTAVRDSLIAVCTNKLFDGETQQGVFQASQTGHTLTVWVFRGISFLKLGIGFAIATIVQNLRATGRASLSAFASAGVPGAAGARLEEPWFSRVFTKFLFAGFL